MRRYITGYKLLAFERVIKDLIVNHLSEFIFQDKWGEWGKKKTRKVIQGIEEKATNIVYLFTTHYVSAEKKKQFLKKIFFPSSLSKIYSTFSRIFRCFISRENNFQMNWISRYNLWSQIQLNCLSWSSVWGLVCVLKSQEFWNSFFLPFICCQIIDALL